MNVNEILQALEYFSADLPREALEAAGQQKEELTPCLLAKLEEWQGKFVNLPENYYLHIYSFLLLAEFREKRAYPLIVDLMLEVGESADDLFGDFLTETLTRVLASVYDGNLEPLFRLINNAADEFVQSAGIRALTILYLEPLLRLINNAADEYVRTAGIQALTILYLEGLLSREEVLTNFEKLGRQYLALEDNLDETLAYLAGALIHESLNIHGTELTGLIDELFDANIVDTFYVSYNNVKEHFTQNTLEETLATQRQLNGYQLINSAIEEMESWFCFQSEEEQERQNKVLETMLTTQMQEYVSSLRQQPSSSPQPSSGRGADLSKAKANPKKKAKLKQQNLSRKKNRKKKR